MLIDRKLSRVYRPKGTVDKRRELHMGGASDSALAAVRRSRSCAGVVIALATLAWGLGASAALGASKPTLSIKTTTLVPYNKAAAVKGTLSTGKHGVLIELQQRVWPFRHAFKTIAKTHTGTGGTYTFKVRPSLATRYRTVAPQPRAKSASPTVYVVKGFKLLRCVLTRSGHSYPGCTTRNSAPPGKYTWRITIELLYPASVYGKEKSKPVYTYFGETKGSQTDPRTLHRKRNVRQHSHDKSTTVINIVMRVTVPHGAYFLAANFCTKTTERTDGFGVPGAPGSHKCGAATIPGKSNINKLG
jgi:hypothetical protein